MEIAGWYATNLLDNFERYERINCQDIVQMTQSTFDRLKSWLIQEILESSVDANYDMAVVQNNSQTKLRLSERLRNMNQSRPSGGICCPFLRSQSSVWVLLYFAVRDLLPLVGALRILRLSTKILALY